MSARTLNRAAATAAENANRQHARTFAALGDETRLSIVSQLRDRAPHSITELAGGSKLTRQAITKHLRVLEGAGIVRSERSGRETRFTLELVGLRSAEDYLRRASGQWDESLARLKSFVEG